MKERYISLMELCLSAYSDAHIRRYFAEVQRSGLTEHGFPRLTANIGILIAHGRRQDLLPLFRAMMDFCCTHIPRVQAANDFSVREIICCLRELDQSNILEKELLDKWRQELSGIDPQTCYTVKAETPEDPVRNWALYTGVSEFFRQTYGLCDSREFIDLQIASQLKWFDENGMYRDNEESEIHQPVVYDLVARGLFCLLLHLGYRGKYYSQVDGFLRKAGHLSLQMQSVTGELPYGGRSNQFLHNEAWLAAIMEFEANRYWQEGDKALAAAYKAGAARALEDVERWLRKRPIRHIKNRFPTESGYGCEDYAYFDKYMITAASFLYAGYLMCNDAIPAKESFPDTPAVFETSEYFHKLFLRCGDYFAELDLNGDPHYDSSGLGRLHRRGAPSASALSVPCASHPNYRLDLENPMALSICPGLFRNGKWHFAAEPDVVWKCITLESTSEQARAEFQCHFFEEPVSICYDLNHNGLAIRVAGRGQIGVLLPSLLFDGEVKTKVFCDRQRLTVSYNGWECAYTTDGQIQSLNRLGGNRNGHYEAFCAVGNQTISVCIQIQML